MSVQWYEKQYCHTRAILALLGRARKQFDRYCVTKEAAVVKGQIVRRIPCNSPLIPTLAMRAHTHTLTHSLLHSLLHSLTHTHTHSLTHSFTHSLTHSLMQPHTIGQVCVPERCDVIAVNSVVNLHNSGAHRAHGQ